MACEGGECKVQIFDVRARKVKIDRTTLYTSGLMGHPDGRKDPGKEYCKAPTEAQKEGALRKKPIWLTDCPNPQKEKKAPCECVFTEDDLDMNRGWTVWVERKVPSEEIEIPGTHGPDCPDDAICKYKLSGSYEESSKILHGACLDSEGLKVPERVKEGLKQRNPKEPE